MRVLALLTALVLVAALGACGSDEDGGDPPRPRGPDFQQRAGQICTDVNDRIVAMEARMQEKARLERDRGADERLDAQTFRRYDRFIQELVRRLSELEAQAPDKATFREYLSRLRRLGRASKATGESWSDPSAGTADLDSIGPAVEKAEDLADRMKLAPCAELSNPALTGSA